jgi:aerobic carbon-monoxide dehydrogenase medium subunit
MHPAPFDYVKAASWPAALELLEQHGEDAKILAGGQSLVPMMNLRLARPAILVDVNGVDGGGIHRVDGTVEIGALTRHHQLETSTVLAEAAPLLSEAAAVIGNIRVRHRGTIGGSLAHADPAAELPCAVMALGGTIKVLGPEGERRIPAGGFFVSYFTTTLEPTEVVVGVDVPASNPSTGSAFLEFVRRAGDFATVEVAAVLKADPSDGTCRKARVVVGGIADRPVDVSEPVGVLAGRPVDERSAAEAAGAATDTIEPREDERASAEYRRDLLRVLVRRALVRAWRRATGEGA